MKAKNIKVVRLAADRTRYKWSEIKELLSTAIEEPKLSAKDSMRCVTVIDYDTDTKYYIVAMNDNTSIGSDLRTLNQIVNDQCLDEIECNEDGDFIEGVYEWNHR